MKELAYFDLDGESLEMIDLAARQAVSEVQENVGEHKENHAPSNAEKNTIVGIKKNGVALTPDNNREVNITVPAKVSELENDEDFVRSTDVDTKLNAKLNASLKGAAGGLAELDSSGKVPSSQLPSYVDDVLEYSAKSSFPTTGETGKIYVDTSTNKTYRWSGSAYTEISASLALGTTSSTAYRGDRGEIAYEHSQAEHAPVGAEANQNAFSNVKVGSTTINAKATTDTFEIVAGDNVTITPDATNKKVTIKATDTVYEHPDSGVSAGTYKNVTVDENGHVTGGNNDTLSIADGGTGATTAKGAEYNIIGGISESTAELTDSAQIVFKRTTPTAANGVLLYKKASLFWKYIKGKADSVYAALTHTHDDRYYTESEMDTKLNAKLNASLKGAADGLAELDSSGKVPSSQLPSYVDDVLEYSAKSSFPTTGETGKIYVDTSTNKTYRWSGSAYTEISASLALGTTSSTAYRGDRGEIAYEHSQVTSGNPHGVTKSDVGLGNVPNVTTDNQTPTFSMASSLTALVSGEKLSVAFGKIAKAISTLISHVTASATASALGHVKLSDTYDRKVDGGDAANGVGASQNALYEAYNALLEKSSDVDANATAGYNEETDSLWVLKDGERIDALKLYLDTYNLYANGENGGEFIAYAGNTSSVGNYTRKAPTLTKSESLTVSLTGTTGSVFHVGCAISKEIDLSRFNTLTFKHQSVGTGGSSETKGVFFISEDKNEDMTPIVKENLFNAYNLNNQSGEITIDISDLNGTYYIGVEVQAYSTATATVEIESMIMK